MSTVAALPPSAVPNGVMLVIRAPPAYCGLVGDASKGGRSVSPCSVYQRLPIIMDYHGDQAVVIKDGL